MVRASIRPRLWTPADEALLAQLLHEGKDLKIIATQLNRTVASVQRRASDLRGPTERSGTLSFRDYVLRRRSTYTQEWKLLQQLKKDAAFLDARSWEEIDRYLSRSDASLGIRSVARSVWVSYQQAKRKWLANVRE
jgi:hypothetical protein